MDPRHSLSGKNTENLTGVCSVCGPVAIRRSGTGYQCANKKAQSHKAWASANPEQAAANRRHRSQHVLADRDRQNMTATCSKCGPVKLTPWGRGVICATLAASRRTVQEKSSQGTCRECWIIDGSKVWLTAAGCPACLAWAPSLEPRPAERRDIGGREVTELTRLGFYQYDDDEAHDEPYGSGFSIVQDRDDHEVPDYETAVPGWRTLGSKRPWNEV
jgi:hypothetical protein